jgi:hypothetical protein
MNRTLIIGAGVVVAGGLGLFLWSRRAAAATARPLATRWTSIDRSPAGGNFAPVEYYAPPPTVFETLEGAGPPPPPPPGGRDCPAGYEWTDHPDNGSVYGGCQPSPPPPPLTVPSPAPSKSCGTFDVVCKAKRAASAVGSAAKTVGKAVVDVNKKYVSYSVDQFKKGAQATAGEKIKAYQQGVTRGAA